MTQKIEEEYEFSANSESAIRFWWPDSLTPQSWNFEQNMRSLQLELIAGHMYLMSPSDKARALKAVQEIKQQMKEHKINPVDLELRALFAAQEN